MIQDQSICNVCSYLQSSCRSFMNGLVSLEAHIRLTYFVVIFENVPYFFFNGMHYLLVSPNLNDDMA